MQLSALLVLLPALACAQNIGEINAGRDQLESIRQQIENNCNGAGGTIASLANQVSGEAGQALNAAGQDLGQNCHGVQQVLARVVDSLGSIGSSFQDADQGNAGRFD